MPLSGSLCGSVVSPHPGGVPIPLITLGGALPLLPPLPGPESESEYQRQ